MLSLSMVGLPSHELFARAGADCIRLSVPSGLDRMEHVAAFVVLAIRWIAIGYAFAEILHA